MFNRIARLPQLQDSQRDTVAIEGFFDTLGNLFSSVEKKPDAEERQIHHDLQKISTEVGRTYGNPHWVSRTGLTKAEKVSGKNIVDDLEIDGHIPGDLPGAIARHIAVAKPIVAKWNKIINAHTDVIHKAIADAMGIRNRGQDQRTLHPDQAKRLIDNLKNVDYPNLSIGTSFEGLMGAKMFNSHILPQLYYGYIPPIPGDQIPQIAGLTQNLLKTVAEFKQEFTLPNGIPTEDDLSNEVVGLLQDEYYKLGGRHVLDLIGWHEQGDAYFSAYVNLEFSPFSMAHSLERWMHRSVK